MRQLEKKISTLLGACCGGTAEYGTPCNKHVVKSFRPICAFPSYHAVYRLGTQVFQRSIHKNLEILTFVMQ